MLKKKCIFAAGDERNDFPKLTNSSLIRQTTHTMSELARIIPKSTKSFGHLEFLFMHWTKLIPKN